MPLIFWSTIGGALRRSIPALRLDALLHALLAFKSLPEEQRGIWQNMLNFYVFDHDEESVAHIPKARRGVLGPLDEKLAQSIRQQLSNNLKD